MSIFQKIILLDHEGIKYEANVTFFADLNSDDSYPTDSHKVLYSIFDVEFSGCNIPPDLQFKCNDDDFIIKNLIEQITIYQLVDAEDYTWE